MKPFAVVAVSLASSVGLCAQASLTSPKGFDQVEGSGYQGFFFLAPDARWQQFDSSHVGRPAATFKSLAFRRDAFEPLQGGPRIALPKPYTIEVRMAHADPDPAKLTTSFAANYKGQPAVAFAKKPIVLPDWSNRPASVPGPWTIHIPFDVPWSYNGSDAFLWEMVGAGPAVLPGEYWFADGQDNPATVAETGAEIGRGCKIADVPFGMGLPVPVYFRHGATVQVTRQNIEVNLLAFVAPRLVAPLVAIDISPRNLTLPGLCRPIYALPILAVQLPQSSSVTGQQVRVPVDPALAGAVLHSQGLFVDTTQPGLPVAMSNGVALRLPPAPPEFGVYHLRGLSSAATSTIMASGMIARLEY